MTHIKDVKHYLRVATIGHDGLLILYPKTIIIPRPSDQLIIVNDGAVRDAGIGAVMYVMRSDRMLLGGYFSAKLKPHQQKWLPCEVEALAISAAIQHWSPYIIQSMHPCQILSDSKPCIEAYGKLLRGEYSTSARIQTFLATLSRYNVSLQHISGTANIPADYLSRNPMECLTQDCQICKFIAAIDESVIRSVTVGDILDGNVPMPYTNPVVWKAAQHHCRSLRRTSAHLLQGTRPGKKMTRIKDVKRYLRVATIGHDGLLIVKHAMPFQRTQSLIIVPRHVLEGLLTALHLHLNHPTTHQLKQVFHKWFYALSADDQIEKVSTSCCQCAALAKLPKEVTEFTTTKSPAKPGVRLSCDVMRRCRQKIILIRDDFSSYTKASFINDEKATTLRDAIIQLSADIKATDGCVIRVDGATAMQSLVDDPGLKQQGIRLEVGRLKNVNKNPIAEKAIMELEIEIKKAKPEGGPISATMLAIVVRTLNDRIRNRGLSAKEILYQRDNQTGLQLHFNDAHMADNQYATRTRNHPYSAKSKAPKGVPPIKHNIHPGDLVFLKDDGSKHNVRDRYIVSSCKDGFIYVNKLAGSQLRSREYKVKHSQVYPVPFHQFKSHCPTHYERESDTASSSDNMDYVNNPIVGDQDSAESASAMDNDVDDYGNLGVVNDQDDSEPDIPASDAGSDSEIHENDNSDYVSSDESIVDNSDTESSGDSDVSSVHDGQRRARRPPEWMRSGEYDLT